MKKTLLTCTALFASIAFAQAPSPSATRLPSDSGSNFDSTTNADYGSLDPNRSADATPTEGDLSRTGPMSRLPKHEREDKKQLEAFFKAWGNAWKEGNSESLAAMIDFPVLMITDDARGNFTKTEMSQERWLDVMKPMVAKAGEKEAQVASDHKMWTHKASCFVLSDDLASCETEASVFLSKSKGDFRRAVLMTRTSEGWKIKSLVEAGWGDMHPASASNDVPVGGE